MRRTHLTACVLSAVCLPAVAPAMSITLTPDAGLAANAPALAAFQRAANTWSAKFTDPINVQINAGLSTSFPSPLIIGSTSATFLTGGYTAIRNQIVADAADEPSNAIVAALPTAATFTANLPAGYSLNGNVDLTQANAKALGFTGLSGSDGTITFNSNFAFDYDNSNGVTAGTIDFETVALHELGHALGFVSAVDDVDYSTSAFAVAPEPVDLFRFNGTSAPSAAAFATAARELRPNTAAVTSDASAAYRMSTGETTGDGRQASHWKDDSLTGTLIGVMDPTLSFGTVIGASAADIRAFDLIGYDVAVPEPVSLAMLALGGLALARRRA